MIERMVRRRCPNCSGEDMKLTRWRDRLPRADCKRCGWSLQMRGTYDTPDATDADTMQMARAMEAAGIPLLAIQDTEGSANETKPEPDGNIVVRHQCRCPMITITIQGYQCGGV